MAFIKETFFIQSPMPAFLFLMRQFHITQKEAQRWLDKQRVITNHHTCRKGDLIQGKVEVIVFKTPQTTLSPIFHTHDFAIFNKPPHLLSHPKGYFNAPSMLDHIKAFHPQATLTHRLDKETSGLLLVAHNPKVTQELGLMFMQRSIQKTYLASVHGKITRQQTISLPLLKQKKGSDLCIRTQIHPQGKDAHTSIKPLQYDPYTHTTLLEITPLTGRTHQIRAHLNAINHPILGDPLYGSKDHHTRIYLNAKANIPEEQYLQFFGAKRLMLHAYKLEFTFKTHPFIVSCPSAF